MFQYRLYPGKKEEQKLDAILEECRWLYNHLLAKRRDAYEQEGKSLTLYQQQATYPILKTERPSLNILSLGLQALGNQPGEAPAFGLGSSH